MKKREPLEVITAVILIAIAFSLIIIVVVIVKNVWEKPDNTESCSDVFEKLEIDSKYTYYNQSSNELQFSISVGNINVDEVLVSISGKGTTKTLTITNKAQTIPGLTAYQSGSKIKLPGKNTCLTYIYDMRGFSNKPDSITISPVIDGTQCGVCDSLYEINTETAENNSCVSNCSCASNTCVGSNCPNSCGGTCAGTLKPDCGIRECGEAPNSCGNATECGICNTSYICVNGTCVKTNQTCAQLGGTICTGEQYCLGNILNALDSTRCCNASCSIEYTATLCKQTLTGLDVIQQDSTIDKLCHYEDQYNRAQNMIYATDGELMTTSSFERILCQIDALPSPCRDIVNNCFIKEIDMPKFLYPDYPQFQIFLEPGFIFFPDGDAGNFNDYNFYRRKTGEVNWVQLVNPPSNLNHLHHTIKLSILASTESDIANGEYEFIITSVGTPPNSMSSSCIRSTQVNFVEDNLSSFVDSYNDLVYNPDIIWKDYYGNIQNGLKLNLHIPKNNPSSPFPLVLNVHGGSWNSGDHNDQLSTVALLSRNLAEATIDYRLVPNRDIGDNHILTYNDILKDIDCFLRWLNSPSEAPGEKIYQKYNLDPNQILITGMSAGSHLAWMMSFLQGSITSECSHTNSPLPIKHLIAESGPYNMENWTGVVVELNRIFADAVGHYTNDYTIDTYLIDYGDGNFIPRHQSVNSFINDPVFINKKRKFSPINYSGTIPEHLQSIQFICGFYDCIVPYYRCYYETAQDLDSKGVLYNVYTFAGGHVPGMKAFEQAIENIFSCSPDGSNGNCPIGCDALQDMDCNTP